MRADNARSIVLDLALDMLSEVSGIDKDAIISYLEGRGDLARPVLSSLLSLAEERGCYGVTFEVVDDPHVGYHALLKMLATLNDRLAKFTEWQSPAGVRIDPSGVRFVINKFGEPITPPFHTDEGVRAYLRSLVF